jgi:triacylglycerol lipase
MTPELRSRIEALGADLTPAMLGGTQALFAASAPPLDGRVLIERDLAYGPDERHRLDIFRRPETTGAPVLVFVHGGGFVRGDKRTPGSPFYDNIGGFAANAGLVGVNITYRLAPAHRWPAGPDDMQAAIDWLRGHVAEHGGDPERIYLMGQSAGAVHVASYVAFREPRIAGALLISCLYDIASAGRSPMHDAYYGEDARAYAAASAQAGLLASTVPLFCTVSEFDVADFQRQSAAFVGAWGEARGGYAPMLRLTGHNHLSPVLAVGGPDDTLGPEILTFIRAQEASYG